MYNSTEYFMEDGIDLKDILKSCIYNYYIKYKKENAKDDLQKNKKHGSMESANKEILSNTKGVKVNVLQKQ